MTKYFWDTSAILTALTKRRDISTMLFEDRKLTRYTNEYVIKELRRVLKDNLKLSQRNIEQTIMLVRERCGVVRTPSKEEFMVLNLRDKSDRPVVCSAQKLGCILVTDDELTYQDAARYVRVKHSWE